MLDVDAGKMARILLGVLFLCFVVLFSPISVQAFPFGGQASIVSPCFNSAIYANLGPPIGGPYIWTPATRTYQFGPPQRAGQWLLGNAGAPYFCIVSIQPLTVWPGTHIIMMGSSGPAAAAYSTPPPAPNLPAIPPASPPLQPGDICRSRIALPFDASNDVCDDPNLTCDEIVALGYKFVARCPGTMPQ
jgi:hypothetical protein